VAALQGIRGRIRSVRSTRQITKAMQMVAASKLRRAQEAAQAPQDYAAAGRELLAKLSSFPEVAQHPLYRTRRVDHGLMIVVAGDRGMAGAYNSNILKAMSRHVVELGVPQHAVCIGRHAAMHVARLEDVEELAAFDIEGSDADIALAQPALESAVRLFMAGKVDAVHLVYTKFHSTVRQEAVIKQLLPVVLPDEGPAGTPGTLEPEAEALLDYATRRLLEAEVLQAILVARATEHAARMMAMMNATDNAGELIDALTLTYNDARQAAITQELAEISAGAEAINQLGA
jgi:F-type H+-transporting ATPase subunit gamma